jgi:hypothetical protein
MGTLDLFDVLDKKLQKETLHINSNANRVSGELSLLKFRDKDTRQMVFYIPLLELTSYGATEQKALEMMNFSVQDFFTYLMSLPTKKREAELLKLGWKNSILRNKEFSKAYVEVSTQLQNFNAVADKVERLTLQAA